VILAQKYNTTLPFPTPASTPRVSDSEIDSLAEPAASKVQVFNAAAPIRRRPAANVKPLARLAR
jgi:hypothetical protein